MKNIDKIKNYIDQLNEPFTAKRIVCELGLTYAVAGQCLRKLLLEGYIRFIDIHKYEKIYARSTYQENITDFMSNKNKIKNYILNSKEPFSMRNVASEIGLSYPNVRECFPNLVAEDYAIFVGMQNSAKLFISKDYKGSTIDLTIRNKIVNFVKTQANPLLQRKFPASFLYHIKNYTGTFVCFIQKALSNESTMITTLKSMSQAHFKVIS